MLQGSAAAAFGGGGGGGDGGGGGGNYLEGSRMGDEEEAMNGFDDQAGGSGGGDLAASAREAVTSTPTSADLVAPDQERLKREKLQTYFQIERYKKIVTYCILLTILSVIVAVVAVAWRFSEHELTYEQRRRKILSTPSEETRLCTSEYPKSIGRNFSAEDVGERLYLTPLIEAGDLDSAVERSRVTHILQSEKSYSGLLTVNKTTNSNLFFWYFPSRQARRARASANVASAGDDDDDDDDESSRVPLVLWLQGGPGWPSMYGLFKENGPYVVGWDDETGRTFLNPNEFSWTEDQHMLYIDSPVGTGFSFTDADDGYRETDEDVAKDVLEALRQFMMLFPKMTSGQSAMETPFYAFGESYGGAYVVSLAHMFLKARNESKATNKADSKADKDPFLRPVDQLLNFRGLGIGNGFLSAADQSLYAEYFNAIGYVSNSSYNMIKTLDDETLKAHREGRYEDVISQSQAALNVFTTSIMNLTNIYDFTFNDNYLTNNEYVCFLQKEHARRGLHVGDVMFGEGHVSYAKLNKSITRSKKEWLNEVLDAGIEALIYNGNLDVIVNVPGMNRVVNSLSWSDSASFFSAGQQMFWVWNDRTERGELAGYVTQGGGLTYAIVRNAGHMVPISQPRWARSLVREFTRKKPGRRFEKPKEIKRLRKSVAFADC